MSTPADPTAVDERLRRIQSVTDVELARLDVEDMLVELLDRVRELLEVDTATVLLLDEPSGHLIATAARGLEEEVRQGVRIPFGVGFAGRVAAERRPVVLDRVDSTTVFNPILREKKIRTLLGVPLMAGSTVVGVLHVGSLVARHFDEEDINLLQLAAERIALATQVRRSQIERAAAEALQRSLVPARLPMLPGLDVAGRYVPGEESGVGGDWYDLFTLPSGRLCLVIGDVVGHGLRAAVVMGRLRSALRAYALEHGGPAEVLSKLDSKVLHFEPGAMATVLYAVLDPTRDRLRVSSAGHLAPVMAVPGEPATLLDLPVDPPLGVRLGVHRRTSTVELPPGALLCLYTDGLIERRTVPIDAGLHKLCAAVTTDDAESVCATVMDRLIGREIVDDDVAMLVVRRNQIDGIAPLDLTVPAVPKSLLEIRRAAEQWLTMAGATPEDITEFLIVIGEATSNAVEHAYGPQGGDVTMRLEFSAPDVFVTIRDNGSWRQPRGQGRGFGTRLIEHCSDQVQVDSGPAGTEVRARRRLNGREPQ
jgi:serine phosphatase RsbU (regulator of sigma subunit)/anti-sigma regulatory factor (Ser/Thr protein kinase)